MTINGQGLKGDNLHDDTVTVNGVPCSVNTSTSEQITCISDDDQPAPAYDDESAFDDESASDDVKICLKSLAFSTSLDEVSQPGSPGLIQTLTKSIDSDDNPNRNMPTDGNVPVDHT